MSTQTKWTQGPLTVRMASEWPWNIETVNAAGEVVFYTQLYCLSSDDKTAKEALDCAHIKADKREEYSATNYRALADETIRAAAPELYKALEALTGVVQSDSLLTYGKDTPYDKAIKGALAVLKKARGE